MSEIALPRSGDEEFAGRFFLAFENEYTAFDAGGRLDALPLIEAEAFSGAGDVWRAPRLSEADGREETGGTCAYDNGLVVPKVWHHFIDRD